jgi:hypothetical protein
MEGHDCDKLWWFECPEASAAAAMDKNVAHTPEYQQV